MISLDTARQLRDAGLRWEPATGDRFVVLDRDMDSEVFMLSDMTVEVHGRGGRRVFGFNGTTEWALDSVEERDSVWLPRESQLRELLAGVFRSLSRVDGQWQVDTEVNGSPASFRSVDAEQAYGQALLQLVTRALG